MSIQLNYRIIYMHHVTDIISEIKANMNGNALNKLECYTLIDKAYKLIDQYDLDLRESLKIRIEKLKEQLDE